MESLFQSIPYSPIMGDSAPKPAIACCPMCGKGLSGLTSKESHSCPACGFDILLVQAPEKQPLPVTVPAYVPQFIFWLVAVQMVLAGLVSGLFFFFASPFYSPFSLIIVGIHLASIGAILAFAWALRKRRAVFAIRIALLVLGVFSLPLGTLAIAAALGIAPLRRWCCTCGKSLRWSAYIECPHCEASMHRVGRCRQNQFHHIAGLLDYTPSQSEIEQICTNCLKVMNEAIS